MSLQVEQVAITVEEWQEGLNSSFSLLDIHVAYERWHGNEEDRKSMKWAKEELLYINHATWTRPGGSGSAASPLQPLKPVKGIFLFTWNYYLKILSLEVR